MPPQDEFDTIIADVMHAAPPPSARPSPERGQGHPVLRFAAGLGLFTIDAYLLIGGAKVTWMLLHL